MPIVVAVVSVTRAGRARPIGHSRTCAGRRLPLVSKIARSPPGETRLGEGGGRRGTCLYSGSGAPPSLRPESEIVRRSLSRAHWLQPPRSRTRLPLSGARDARSSSLAGRCRTERTRARPACGGGGPSPGKLIDTGIGRARV